jgi:AcrR family transcriptional regulator
VFAHKGFHTSRVGDIAEEAGVAHGLLYHYFSSKDEVLDTIFRETWSDLLVEIDEIESSAESARDQLQRVASRLLGGWREHPDVIRVLVREIARSAEVQQRIGELVKPIESIQRIIARGQETGEFRDDFDARVAGILVYGGIEEVLSGWVLGQIPDGADAVEAAERTLIDVLCAGFATVPASLRG